MYIASYLITMVIKFSITIQSGISNVTHTTLLFITATIIALLGGCSSTPKSSLSQIDDAVLNRARQLVADDNHLGAAQLYLSAAKTAPKNLTSELQLRAAEHLARGQHWESLNQILVQLKPAALNKLQSSRYTLLRAILAVNQQNPEKALTLLETIETPEAFEDQGRQYLELRATAYALTGNALEAARQLIWLDGQLSDAKQRLENEKAIWQHLSGLSDLSLQHLRTTPSPDALSGWMELIQLSRASHRDHNVWQQQLQAWRDRYPAHMAEAVFLPLVLTQSAEPTTSDRIALMLPLTSSAKKSAAAIRDGILAAYYADHETRPELLIYDTKGDHQQIWALYQQAIADGAQMVIGPLLKSSIQVLAQSGPLQIPVLALNQIASASDTDNHFAPGSILYQFGLSPENEAQQVAERMYAEGHLRIAALVPESGWGQRVFEAFEQRYSMLGGQILDISRYNPKDVDFKSPIQRVMNLDKSKSRYRSLKNTLGKSPEYNPRRRQDIDAVLVLGFPRQARLLKPQLRFHHAADLPVYSTSHVYNGSPNVERDRDMNGLYFCDIPWLLDSQGPWRTQRKLLKSIWPARSQHYQRLFALGIDAYGVLPWLGTLDSPAFSYYPGATGELFLEHRTHLYRSLQWAQFVNGMPQRIFQNVMTEAEQ